MAPVFHSRFRRLPPPQLQYGIRRGVLRTIQAQCKTEILHVRGRVKGVPAVGTEPG